MYPSPRTHAHMWSRRVALHPPDGAANLIYEAKIDFIDNFGHVAADS